MKITWIGQAGLVFEADGTTIIVDPYLSDSVVKVNPANYRRIAVDESFLKIQPDVFLCTHNHLDHLDPETVPYYMNSEKPVLVLSPKSVWDELRKFGGNNNYVMFNRGTVWTYKEFKFTAVAAEHSDDYAIGIIIDYKGKTYYITGDTLYNKKIFKHLPNDIDVIFLPINGVGNNMNMTDAAKFAKKTKAKTVVPVHWGMFDELTPNGMNCDNIVIPEIYKEIRL